jgi:glycosyltransferase involved in cell wall biosynthesis
VDTSGIQKENAVIYQGAWNVGRGLEELIAAFAQPILHDYHLWIFGEGDIQKELQEQSKQLGLEDQVRFFGRLSPEELRKYTSKALLGVSIEKMEGKNYEYALPNKVFDYLHAGIPVLYSSMKEVIDLLSPYQVGEELRSYEAESLAEQLHKLLSSPNYNDWVKNTEKAAAAFCWEKEEKVLLKLVEHAS